jgi:hypothetical protein
MVPPPSQVKLVLRAPEFRDDDEADDHPRPEAGKNHYH